MGSGAGQRGALSRRGSGGRRSVGLSWPTTALLNLCSREVLNLCSREEVVMRMA